MLLLEAPRRAVQLLLALPAPYFLALLIGLLLGFPAVAGEGAPLSLAEALRVASERSAQLAAQRSAVSAAEQLVTPARELPDPKLLAGIDNLPVDGADRFSTGADFMTMRRIGVMQEFPRAVKRELKGRRAEHEVGREQAVLEDTRAALRRDVARWWSERYFAEQMAQLVRSQYAETELQRQTMQAGVAGGKTQPAELYAVQVALQSLLDQEAEFDGQGARAQAMLSRWLGEDSRRPLASAAQAAHPGGAQLQHHVGSHPHIKTMDRQIDAASTEAELTRAASKPDWSVEVAYAKRGPNFSNMVSVGVSIDLPIFQAKRQDRELASRLAKVKQAQALKEDALRLHLAEAAAAEAEWDAATRRLQRYDTSLLPLSRQRIEAALAAYRGGRGELAAVLEARRAELDLELQKLQLTAEQARAYAELIYFLPEGEAP